MLRTLLVLGLLVHAGSVIADEVYKWTDENGQTVYGNAPPPGVKTRKVEGGVSVVPATQIPGNATAGDAPEGLPSDKEVARRGDATKTPADERAAKRTRMIEHCKADRGVDCEREVDAKLDGQPSQTAYEEVYPVVVRPHPPKPIKPRPVPKPEPKPYKPDPLPVAPAGGFRP